MTRQEALTDLLEACNANTSRANFEGAAFSVWPEATDHFKAIHASGSYVGSLDAAKALHEAVLPGWVVSIVAWFSSPSASVSVGNEEEVYDKDPARAWLIAIIKALIAMENDT